MTVAEIKGYIEYVDEKLAVATNPKQIEFLEKRYSALMCDLLEAELNNKLNANRREK